jgi:hypothetical protein
MSGLDIDFEVYVASCLLEWRGTSGSFHLKVLFNFSTNLFFQYKVIGYVSLRLLIAAVGAVYWNLPSSKYN